MLNNLSIKNKFVLIQLVAMAMLLGSLAFSFIQFLHMSETNKANIEEAQLKTSVAVQLGSMASAVTREAKAVRDVWLLGGDDEQKDKGRSEYTDQIDIFSSSSALAKADLQKLVASDPVFQPFEEKLSALIEAHGQITAGMLPKIDAFSGHFDGNMPSAGAEKKLFRQLQVLRNDFVKVLKENDTTDMAGIDAAFIRQRNIIMAVAVGSSLLLFTLLLMMSRAITRPLINLHKVMTEVETSRDFSLRVKNLGRDELGQTAQSFNQLVESMQAALAQIRSGVDDVAKSAHELSEASANVAHSSETQSDAASSMAATVEEVVVSISHVTDRSNEARDSARRAGVLAQEGSTIIRNTASGMAAIATTVRNASETIETLGRHSSEISSVVKTIEEVAEQTNLLALNAAIEAARAGEQGRGFAVVADEVRKLAERTTSATHEIGQMIADIQNSSKAAVASMSSAVGQVDEGVRLAARAGEAIDQISEGAQQVDMAVDSIATALVEQSSANNSIANNVESVAQKAEANHVDSMGAAKSAVRLEGLAKGMSDVVAQFKI